MSDANTADPYGARAHARSMAGTRVQAMPTVPATDAAEDYKSVALAQENLINTTMETYLQDAPASCMACHQIVSNSKGSDFVGVLAETAKSTTTCGAYAITARRQMHDFFTPQMRWQGSIWCLTFADGRCRERRQFGFRHLQLL